MFEYVRDIGLKPASPYTARRVTDLIVLHMSGGGERETVRGIHEYHISRGHKGIDYNICVTADGQVVWGRGLTVEGGHVNNSVPPTKGVNARSVGIAALGDFERIKMPEVQKKALQCVVRDVAKHFSLGVGGIVTHMQIAGEGYTDCPGKHFPLADVLDFVREKKENRQWEVGAKKLVMREAPYESSNIIAELKQGDKVSLERYVAGELWARILQSERIGWVKLAGLREQDGDKKTWKVAVGSLNLRSKPELSTKVLSTLRRGDRVSLERYVLGENWARVTHNGTEGWVWLDYIEE